MADGLLASMTITDWLLVAAIVAFLGKPGLKALYRFRGVLPPAHRALIEAAGQAAGAAVEERVGPSRLEAPSLATMAVYRALKGAAGIGIAIVSHEGKPIFANRYLCRMIGYTEAELTALKFGQFTHPDYINRDEENYRRLIEGSITYYRMDKAWLRKDGTPVRGDLVVTLAPNGSPETPYALAFVVPYEDQTTPARGVMSVGTAAKKMRAAQPTPEPLPIIDPPTPPATTPALPLGMLKRRPGGDER